MVGLWTHCAHHPGAWGSQGPVRAGIEFLVIVTLGTLAGVDLGLLLHAG
jgi:hypothetical protein